MSYDLQGLLDAGEIYDKVIEIGPECNKVISSPRYIRMNHAIHNPLLQGTLIQRIERARKMGLSPVIVPKQYSTSRCCYPEFYCLSNGKAYRLGADKDMVAHLKFTKAWDLIREEYNLPIMMNVQEGKPYPVGMGNKPVKGRCYDDEYRTVKGGLRKEAIE